MLHSGACVRVCLSETQRNSRNYVGFRDRQRGRYIKKKEEYEKKEEEEGTELENVHVNEWLFFFLLQLSFILKKLLHLFAAQRQ